MKKITILIPAYNEQDVLYKLYARLKNVLDNLNYDFEILFVDDGSSDNTPCIIKNLRYKDGRVSYITLSRNFGKEIAMIAGLDYAAGDAVIIIDADLQDPPELIPEMIKYWEEGYDDVYAKRRSRAGETWFKKTSSMLFYRLLKKLSKIPIQEDTGDFRLLDRRCVEALKHLREKQRYTKGMFSWIGYNKKEILFDRLPRAGGTSKWNYGMLINLALEGITCFTVSPLRLPLMIGCICFSAWLVFTGAIIVRKSFYNMAVSFSHILLSVVLLLFCLMFICIWVMGEYVGRIFNETKDRPLYLVDEYNGRKVQNTERYIHI